MDEDVKQWTDESKKQERADAKLLIVRRRHVLPW